MSVIRDLGFMEARMHLMQSGFNGTTQGGLALRVEGELDTARFADALRHVQARYALLRCVIVPNASTGQFCFAEPAQPAALPLQVLERLSDTHWQTLLQSLNDQPLPASEQLWHMVILQAPAHQPQQHDLLLRVHHALMDGTAADTFFDAVLACYAQGSAQVLPDVPVPPAAEHAVPASLRLSWADYLAWQRAQPNLNASLPALPHQATPPLSARHSAFSTCALTAAQTSALEHAAKAQGVSLNSLLSAALLEGVSAAVPGRAELVLHSTFSLRRLCAPRIHPTELACCMAIVSTLHPVPAPSLAAQAQTHHAALARAVLQQIKQAAEVDTAAVQNGMAALAQQTQFTSDIAFTFGESRLKPRYGDLAVLHLFPVVNRRLGNLAVAVHGVRLNGACHLTFNHTAPLQDATVVALMQQRFMANLLAQLALSSPSCVMDQPA